MERLVSCYLDKVYSAMLGRNKWSEHHIFNSLKKSVPERKIATFPQFVEYVLYGYEDGKRFVFILSLKLFNLFCYFRICIFVFSLFLGPSRAFLFFATGQADLN